MNLKLDVNSGGRPAPASLPLTARGRRKELLRVSSLAHVMILLLTLTMPAVSHAETDMQIANRTLTEMQIPIDNDTFISFVNEGKMDIVKLFLRAGAHASTQNKDGVSAVMTALKNKNMEMFNFLMDTLQRDGSITLAINVKDNTGRTVLIIAIEQGDEKIVDNLLANGAEVTVGPGAKTSPLIAALRQKSESIAKKILEVDAKSTPPYSTVDFEDATGSKALSYAIHNQQPEIVKLLLAAHADGVKADSLGVTPLMLAAKGGNEAIAQMLIDAGAKINAADKAGHTSISIAIRAGNGKLARMLIEKDPAGSASMNYASALSEVLAADKIDAEFFAYLLDHTSKTETLPPALLFKALDRKNHDVAKLLMARKPDATATNQAGETLFYHAVDAGFEDIAIELMEMGANTAQSGEGGASPMARAVRHNMAKVVEALVAKGASVDQKTAEGYTLAEICVYSGYAETLEVLMNHGVNIEKQFALLWSIRDGKGKAVPVLMKHGASSAIMNQDGVPAITLAAEAGQTEAVKAFIEHKAVLDYPSKNQQMTALASAARGGHLEVVKMLTEAGAKLESIDNYGMTPLAHAAWANKYEVVEYLLSKGASVTIADSQKRTVMDIAGQAPASPERDKIMQLLVKASSPAKPAP